MIPPSFYGLLADLLLVVHFAYVSFVVLGMILIWVGYFRNWSFVRNFWFRLTHVLSIGIVTAESLTGVTCPLTTWENTLRWKAGGGQQYHGSFIQHWIHRVMFYQAGETTFTIIYVSFFSLVLLSFWLVAPRWSIKKLSLKNHI